MCLRAPKKVPINYQNGKIYKIVNSKNDIIYIGSSTTTLPKRMNGHKSSSKKQNSLFYTAMQELGDACFKIILIKPFPCNSKAELEAEEWAVMNTYDKTMLYNSIFDGKQSEATKRKMSEMCKGSNNSNFKRGCITTCEKTRSKGFRYVWYENCKLRERMFAFGRKRTREMAFMACVDVRNAMYPLSNLDNMAQLPWAISQ